MPSNTSLLAVGRSKSWVPNTHIRDLDLLYEIKLFFVKCLLLVLAWFNLSHCEHVRAVPVCVPASFTHKQIKTKIYNESLDKQCGIYFKIM